MLWTLPEKNFQLIIFQDHKAYVDAGGKPLDDERKCGAIMSKLSEIIRTEIILKHEKSHNQPMLLRQWVLHHAKLLVSWQDARGAKPDHVFEDQKNGGEEDAGEHEELPGMHAWLGGSVRPKPVLSRGF